MIVHDKQTYLDKYTKPNMIELHELFDGTDISMLNDYVIDTMLDEAGFELSDGVIERNSKQRSLKFYVSWFDTVVDIDCDNNVIVSEAINNDGRQITILSYNGKEFVTSSINKY